MPTTPKPPEHTARPGCGAPLATGVRLAAGKCGDRLVPEHVPAQR